MCATATRPLTRQWPALSAPPAIRSRYFATSPCCGASWLAMRAWSRRCAPPWKPLQQWRRTHQDGLERKARLDVGDAWNTGQGPRQELLVSLEVGHHHPQCIVGVARHLEAEHDFGRERDPFFEAGDHILRLCAQGDRHEHTDAARKA